MVHSSISRISGNFRYRYPAGYLASQIRYPAGYLASQIRYPAGYPANQIRYPEVKSGIRPDTACQKGRISGASLINLQIWIRGAKNVGIWNTEKKLSVLPCRAFDQRGLKIWEIWPHPAAKPFRYRSGPTVSSRSRTGAETAQPPAIKDPCYCHLTVYNTSSSTHRMGWLSSFFPTVYLRIINHFTCSNRKKNHEWYEQDKSCFHHNFSFWPEIIKSQILL
jgi:hypothetical protein